MAKFLPQNSITGDLTEALTYFVVSNAITITKGNAVVLTGGYVENHNGNVADRLLGVAAETVLGTTASVEVGVYCDPNILYHNDADGDLTIAYVGQCFRVTAGGTQIDQSSATAESTTQFILVKRDPDGSGDASTGWFKPYKTLLGGGI